jgi:carboxypeptidase PM20D1
VKTRRVALVLATGVGALGAVLVANTLRVAAPAGPPSAPSAARAPVVDAALVASHLAATLRVQTISHEDRAEDDPTAVGRLHAVLAATYPRVHAALAREELGDGGLLFTWKGSDASLRPAILAAHQDVVPVEPGTEAAWREPPFAGAVSGGFVWGRGALDDKLSLVGLLEAAESLLAEGFTPRRTILLAFGADEEVSGERGAKVIAAALAARGVRAEYVLDEGMAVTEGIFPDVSPPVAVIGLGEKGFATLELVVDGAGGHSSMPPVETAVSVLASAVARVAAAPMPARMTEATRRSLERLAPYLPFGKRIGAANLWLLEPLVVRALASQNVTSALVRTTTAPTMFQAGVKENVLPSRARAAVNFRILPGDTVEGVVAHVTRAVADSRVQIRVMPGFPHDPPPLASADSAAYRRIEQAVQRIYPTAVVAPGLVLGATDGRHYAGVADAVYHFVPFVVRGAAERDQIHGTNERVPVADLEAAVAFYRELMRDGG